MGPFRSIYVFGFMWFLEYDAGPPGFLETPVVLSGGPFSGWAPPVGRE